MNDESPCVFLVDDDPVMLVLWSGILQGAGHRVESFEQPEALLRRLSPKDRGCVLVDLRMPRINGLELQRALVDRGITLPLIFVSAYADVRSTVTAIKLGAVDFLAKPITPTDLRSAVDRALEQDREISRDRAERTQARALWGALTPREREICRLFGAGMTDTQIASELGTTVSMVQTQRTGAMQKLLTTTVAEMIQLLIKVGEAS